MNYMIRLYLKRKHVTPKICSLFFCFFLGFAENVSAYELGSDGKCYTAVWYYARITNYRLSNLSPSDIINADYINLVPPSDTLECKNEPDGTDRVWAGAWVCNWDYFGIDRYVFNFKTGIWAKNSGLYPLQVFDGYTAEVIAGLEARFGSPLVYPENLTPGAIPVGCEPPECIDAECKEQQQGPPPTCPTDY